jgi:FOG: LysM repeat
MKTPSPIAIKTLFFSLFCLFASSAWAQSQETETVKGTRKQLVQEILNLRKEVGELQKILNNSISLSDTLSFNDSSHYGALDFINEDDVIVSGMEQNTDSLLSVVYLQRFLSTAYEELPQDLDSITLVADLPDSVYIQRLTAMQSFITLPYNHVVKGSIVHYTQRYKRMPAILGLSNYYMPIFEEIFDQHDLPVELKVMAIIESGLIPKAVSRAKARGMWQFMHATGRQYGLTINSFVDERYDPIVSGHAAAKYLKDSYTIYGDWSLAIASYNCGVGNVNKAIRRANSREFWDIYPHLPRETRGYLPAFVAALYTLNYYKEHGIQPLKIEMPAHVDTFHVSQRLHFNQISESLGISIDELRDLNPQYLHDIIPGRPYILRLPYNYTDAFAEQEQQIYAYKKDEFFNPINQQNLAAISDRNQLIHTVKSGENLGAIARRYGVKVSDVQYWNNIKGNMIHPNQRLVIYTGQAPARSASSTTATSTSSSASSSAPANSQKTTHTVKSGESLGLIAQKYGTTVAKLQSWNSGLRSTIHPGQKITVYVAGTAASSTGSSGSSNPGAGSTNAGEYQIHVVKKGDSLWGIAQAYSISLDNLLKLNNINRNAKIMVGDKLRVKKI